MHNKGSSNPTRSDLGVCRFGVLSDGCSSFFVKMKGNLKTRFGCDPQGGLAGVSTWGGNRTGAATCPPLLFSAPGRLSLSAPRDPSCLPRSPPLSPPSGSHAGPRRSSGR